MDKILVDIYIISIDYNVNIYLPINMLVSEAIKYVCEYINETVNEDFKVDENTKLYDGIEGKIINNNNIVKFSGIKNGAKLLLK